MHAQFASTVSSPFLPWLRGDCQRWVDARFGVVTTGALIESVADQSVHAHNMVKISDALRATLVANSISGQPAFRSDGTKALVGDPAGAGPLHISGPKWVVLVYKINTVPTGNNGYVVFNLVSGASFLVSEYFFSNFTVYLPDTLMCIDDAPQTATALTGSALTLDTNPHVLIHTYNGGPITSAASYADYVDSTTQTMVNKSTDTVVITDKDALFGRVSSIGVVTFGLPADIAAYGVFSGTPTAADITQVRAYTTKVWGKP